MARKPKAKPAGQKPNTYSDEDMLKSILAIEALEAEQRSIRAEAAGRCGGIAKKIEDEKKTAGNLGVPKRLLAATLKQRALERKLQELASTIPDDMIELYEEASGQFSIFKPEDGEDVTSNVIPSAALAAKRAARAAKANSAKEQADAEAMFEEMHGGPK